MFTLKGLPMIFIEQISIMLQKIVTGGQTGVDRCALDVAIELNLDYGGWCPLGRKAEDGMIDPIKYSNLKETSTDDYSQRTELNVRDSDGTLIMTIGDRETMDRGSKFTIDMTEKYVKPLCLINLNENNDANETRILEWISTNKISILNIAGPREENIPGIYIRSKHFLRNFLKKI